MKNCDFCGDNAGSFTTNTYSFNDRQAIFCKECWKQFYNLRFGDEHSKNTANNYFAYKEAHNNITQVGLDCLDYISVQSSQKIMDRELPQEPIPANKPISQEAGNSYGTAGFIIAGILFIIAAIIFYILSIQEVGGYQIANIQMTVFAAANFLASIINFVAAGIVKRIKK